jgi:ribosomal-protein-alanine N-acetyltransferase
MAQPPVFDLPYRLELARPEHAAVIARLSRDRVEQGLGWSWRVARVGRAIASAQSNVVVALGPAGSVLGFGIMSYGDDEAHLQLIAVRADQARRGIGRAIVQWLEHSARIAGVGLIWLETRSSNVDARTFYRRLGYRELERMPGYYQGSEAAVRLGKDLWESPPRPALPAPPPGTSDDSGA